MFLYIYYYLQSVNFYPFAAKKKPKGQHKSKLKEMRKKIPYSPKIMSPERKWISGFLPGYYNLNLLQLTRKKNTI